MIAPAPQATGLWDEPRDTRQRYKTFSVGHRLADSAASTILRATVKDAVLRRHFEISERQVKKDC
jgi:hypothetical protein